MGEVFRGEEPCFEGGDGSGGEFAAGFAGFGFAAGFGVRVVVIGVIVLLSVGVVVGLFGGRKFGGGHGGHWEGVLGVAYGYGGGEGDWMGYYVCCWDGCWGHWIFQHHVEMIGMRGW